MAWEEWKIHEDINDRYSIVDLRSSSALKAGNSLPAELLLQIVEFAPLFSKSVWERAKILLAGAGLF
jgi:hypothetical protein